MMRKPGRQPDLRIIACVRNIASACRPGGHGSYPELGRRGPRDLVPVKCTGQQASRRTSGSFEHWDLRKSFDVPPSQQGDPARRLRAINAVSSLSRTIRVTHWGRAKGWTVEPRGPRLAFGRHRGGCGRAKSGREGATRFSSVNCRQAGALLRRDIWQEQNLCLRHSSGPSGLAAC